MWLILEGLLSARVRSVEDSTELCLHLCEHGMGVSKKMFCIVWHFETGICSCAVTRYELIKHLQIERFVCKLLGMFCLFLCAHALLQNVFFICALVLLCCGKQTWRTSRPREEARWGFVKVKEWSCYVAHHHTLEVRWPILLFEPLYYSLNTQAQWWLTQSLKSNIACCCFSYSSCTL